MKSEAGREGPLLAENVLVNLPPTVRQRPLFSLHARLRVAADNPQEAGGEAPSAYSTVRNDRVEFPLKAVINVCLLAPNNLQARIRRSISQAQAQRRPRLAGLLVSLAIDRRARHSPRLAGADRCHMLEEDRTPQRGPRDRACQPPPDNGQSCR